MSATTTTAELQLIPIERIRVSEGANPRREFDEVKLAELADSIRQHGILQPLIVKSDGDDGFELVAGERRYRAASLAELHEVPAIVRDGEATLEVAVDENLHRQELNPIEEAVAFQAILTTGKLTRSKLAERVSKSSQYVSERLRLLELPETVQVAVASGTVPVRAGKLFARIAKVSEPVASACATLVAAGHAEISELEASPERVIGRLGDFEWDDPAPVAVAVSTYMRYPLEELHLPGEILAELAQRAEELNLSGFTFGHEDADAARAYGCLLEFKHDCHWSSAFITDPGFIADRIRIALDTAEKRRDEQAASQTAASSSVEAEQPSIAERRAQREHAKAERDEARQANFELGRKLLARYDSVELTKPVAQLLAQLVLAEDCGQLAARGLGLANEDWQVSEERPLKRGGVKVVSRPPRPSEAEDMLQGWIGRARTAEQTLGRLLQALIAAHSADLSCVPQSQRPHYTLPGTSSDGPAAQIPLLVERLAKPVLPKRLAHQQRERRQLRTVDGSVIGEAA
jgi:ParB/RepB/Spo0J family partition protein